MVLNAFKNKTYLTNEQLEFFEENGYLLLRNLIDHEILDECKQRFIDICNGKVDTKTMIIVKDHSLRKTGVLGENLINKLENFNNDEILFKYISFKKLVDIIECLIGPNITSLHTMLINKPPNAEIYSSQHSIHQDAYFFPLRPLKSIVAAWTAMEKITKDNGCLFVLPGTHKKGKLYPHNDRAYPKLLAYHEISGFDEYPKVYLPMNNGDTVFIHPLLLHGSGPNLSNGFRKSISCHYIDSNCDFIDVRRTVQDDLAEEVMKMNDMQGRPPKSFQSFWQERGRLLRGPPGNFQRMNCSL